MANPDTVLNKMLEYLESAKDILLAEGNLQATVFAVVPGSVIYLPIVYQEHQSPNVALDLIAKVLVAYSVREYYVVSESYRILQEDGEGENVVQECINILHVGPADKRIIGCNFNRISGSTDIFFSETVEIKVESIEGTINDLFRLKERCPKMSARDKEHIRILFPAKSEKDLARENVQALN